MRPLVSFCSFLFFFTFLAWGQGFTPTFSQNANNVVFSANNSGDMAGNRLTYMTDSASSVVIVSKNIPHLFKPDSARVSVKTSVSIGQTVRLSIAVDSSGLKLNASTFIYAGIIETKVTVPILSPSSEADTVNQLKVAISNPNSSNKNIDVIFKDIYLRSNGIWVRMDSVGVTGIAAIASPALQSPTNAATKVNLSVVFAWFPIAGATDYKVTIWIEGYPDPVIIYSNSSQSAPFSLPPNKIIQWQVTGRVNGVEGPPSQVWTFQTGSTLTGAENNNLRPEVFGLAQNYPNPFNPTTNISFSLAQAGYTELRVYDLLGREISVLVNSEFSAGFHMVEFSGAHLPSGTYVYRLSARGQTEVRKMVLQK